MDQRKSPSLRSKARPSELRDRLVATNRSEEGYKKKKKKKFAALKVLESRVASVRFRITSHGAANQIKQAGGDI